MSVSSPDQALIPSSSRHLVQAAGRQLAIAARLQDEIERDRFKVFLGRHPDLLILV